MWAGWQHWEGPDVLRCHPSGRSLPTDEACQRLCLCLTQNPAKGAAALSKAACETAVPHETIFAQVCRLTLLQLKGTVIFEALWCKFKLCLHRIKHSSAGIAAVYRGSPA